MKPYTECNAEDIDLDEALDRVMRGLERHEAGLDINGHGVTVLTGIAVVLFGTAWIIYMLVRLWG